MDDVLLLFGGNLHSRESHEGEFKEWLKGVRKVLGAIFELVAEIIIGCMGAFAWTTWAIIYKIYKLNSPLHLNPNHLLLQQALKFRKTIKYHL